ncbi:TauD/TfdA family dioxygenase [Bradyrhizobium sp. CCBAU 65884]|uniref:TauD/TfdA family dioxygenase n=1 Tax=Bradyrhizobium sp. CCBAU 65884 TaxID=722477 RepID=UPI003FA45F9F
MVTSDEFARWMASLNYRTGTVLNVTQDVQLEPAAFLSSIKQLGFDIIESNDGAVSIVQEMGDSRDFSRQSGRFPVHTDGLYQTRVPELVLLFCQDAGHGTTPTVVADSRAVFRQPRRPRRIELLKELELVYIGRDGKEFARPLIQSHPHAGFAVVHLGYRAFARASPTAAHLRQRLSRRRAVKILRALRAQIEAETCLRHYWKAGDALLIDNYTFVHGRETQGIDHQRKLLRVWLSIAQKIDSIRN